MTASSKGSQIEEQAMQIVTDLKNRKRGIQTNSVVTKTFAEK